ncbi:TraX family protein (plasmid) [Sphaerotilaceae bacterium SBD11-9]
MSTAVAQRLGASDYSPAPLKLHSGTVEGLKWLALASMTVDHVGKHLLGGAPWAFGVGRLALPLFLFVLAYNLSRVDQSGDLRKRVCKRLFLWGVISTPVCVALNGILPLNIMFTLSLFAALMLLRGGGFVASAASLLLFCAGGALVEYWWVGLAYGFACASYCRRPTGGRMAWLLAASVVLTGSMATLTLAGTHNNVMAAMNFATLLAMPIIFAARGVELAIPRWRYAFYAYYPAHLGVLWAVKTFF